MPQHFLTVPHETAEAPTMESTQEDERRDAPRADS